MDRLALVLAFLLTVASGAAAANDLGGIVVDDRGRPIPGAHVFVYTAVPKVGVSAICPSCYRDCGKRQQVDRKGRFTLKELDPTLLFDVLGTADGYEPAFARRVDPRRGEVRIVLSPRSPEEGEKLIRGVVLDPKGKPVIGALVEPNGYRLNHRIGYGNIPGVDKLSITDAKGEFSLRIPEPDGKLDVRVTARSLAPRIARELVPGEKRTIQLTEGGTISGRVMREGKPVIGTRVGLVQRSRASRNYLGRSEIGTNEEGLFVLPNVAAGETYVVFVPMESVSPGVVMPKTVTISSESDVDAGTLSVTNGRCVEGWIVLPDGATLPPKARVTIHNDLSDDVLVAEAGAGGRFTFNGVPKESVTLTARLPGLVLSPATPGFDARERGVVLPAEADLGNLQLIFVEVERR